MDLTGRTAIVTGASRGIGQAIATALAGAGANVVLTARKRESAEQAAEQVGERAVGFEAHASSDEAARACADFAIERFGSLDILVNNVGTNPAYGPLVDVDHARFSKTIDVNVWPMVLWTGVAWRAWMAEHGGCVINNASIGAFGVEPSLGVYNMSKAAMVHATVQLAIELAPRVRVNALAPGIVRTKLSEALWREHEQAVADGTPLKRIGEPEDVASAALFLASDASSWMTGETVVVDGGQRHSGVF